MITCKSVASVLVQYAIIFHTLKVSISHMNFLLDFIELHIPVYWEKFDILQKESWPILRNLGVPGFVPALLLLLFDVSLYVLVLLC